MKHKITEANKCDKKDILRFYKQQHYSARFLGLDHTYFIKQDELIIASVIVSYITKNNPQPFLHALVVKENHRRQNLASMLLNHCSAIHLSLVCFSNILLRSLYIKNDFRPIDTAELSSFLHSKFKRYHNKNNNLTALKCDKYA